MLTQLGQLDEQAQFPGLSTDPPAQLDGQIQPDPVGEVFNEHDGLGNAVHVGVERLQRPEHLLVRRLLRQIKRRLTRDEAVQIADVGDDHATEQ
ncbi:hypothetical protein DMH04_42030 [Kibdelosporangium aridum]|uniref:Uncharacterized protein n=1 Tax=Kibdelosporangium aridum TaxID=2030 RepID=A0A428YTL3_KIBAR|nr:hypothetical protein DMH04_42030 [Kibdelosporangium aridum]